MKALKNQCEDQPPGVRLHYVHSRSWRPGAQLCYRFGITVLPADARAILVCLGDPTLGYEDLCGCALLVIARAAEPKLRALDDLQRAERISIVQLP